MGYSALLSSDHVKASKHEVTLFLQMAAVKPAAGKPGLEEEGGQIHRIRITLTSRNVKNLEKGKLLPLLPAAVSHCTC